MLASIRPVRACALGYGRCMHVDGIIDCEVLSAPNDPWFEWEGGRGVDPADWARHPELLVGERLRFSFGGFLLRGGALRDRVVLVDVGNGPVSDGFIPAGSLLDALHRHGVAPADVTDVLLTHLHYDHTGWLAVDGDPVFAAATIHLHADDLAYFTDPLTPGRSAELTPARVDAVASHVSTFAGDCTPVPGIRAVTAPGHTPGSTVFVADGDGERVVLLGDVVHCPVQLVDAEWAVLGDVDATLAARSREAIAREMEGAWVGGAHFPGLELGRLIRTEVQRRWLV